MTFPRASIDVVSDEVPTYECTDIIDLVEYVTIGRVTAIRNRKGRVV
jgi:hypothetical protein